MLQSVPVLNHSVSRRCSATVARRSPFAVMSGSWNLAGSSGLNAAGGRTVSFMMLRFVDPYYIRSRGARSFAPITLFGAAIVDVVQRFGVDLEPVRFDQFQPDDAPREAG